MKNGWSVARHDLNWNKVEVDWYKAGTRPVSERGVDNGGDVMRKICYIRKNRAILQSGYRAEDRKNGKMSYNAI